MRVVLTFRNGRLAALLALVGAFLLPALAFAAVDPAYASQFTMDASAADAAPHARVCPELDGPVAPAMPASLGFNCCHWAFGIDSAALALPRSGGGESTAADPPELLSIGHTDIPLLIPRHFSAAAPSLIVLFGRFRE